MKLNYLALTTLAASLVFAAEPPPKPGNRPPSGKPGAGPRSSESPEMKALLESFKLTDTQKAGYAAARENTSQEMRAISIGKRDGSLTQAQVLKQALAAHKAFNAAVKEILSPAQYEQWLPLRESDHHKIAQRHKQRDEAAAKAEAEAW